MKRLYIGSPFFTPAQLATVEMVEQAITESGLAFYSPRLDGVLMEMLPEERKQKSLEIFQLNVDNILNSDAILCVLDDKDTGTTWENGFAYCYSLVLHRLNYRKLNYKLFAYTSTEREINVMLQCSFDYHAQGRAELLELLKAYRHGKDLVKSPSTDKVY